MDNDFRKLFKIKVEFEDDAPRNSENMIKLARFAHGFCAKEGLPQLDRTGVASLVDYATVLANDKENFY